MTYPPYDRPIPDYSGAPASGWGPGYPVAGPQWVPAGPPPVARRSRRGLAVAATLAGVLVVGGTGVAVASYLSGGGAQPEDVLPLDTLGFVKVDLDPSAGQKVELMSLLQKFPALDTQGDRDLRAQLLDPLLAQSGTGLDFAADVQPWLGDRMAVAAVPVGDSPDGIVPVAAVAVTDEGRMTEALTRARQGVDFGFAVRDDYVLITDSQERADGFATAEQTLADDADFAGDREALGGDQVALVWADLSAAQGILAQVGAAAPGGLGDQPLSGRVILGVHAADDAVELVGMDFGVSDFGGPPSEPTRLAQGLPADTLAALSVSGLGDKAVTAWEDVQQSGGLSDVEAPLRELGLELPDDLRVVLGTDLVVGAFGNLDSPGFGVRVVTGDGARAAEIVDGLLADPQIGLPAVSAPVDDGFVLGTDSGTAAVLAAGDGGLGDTDAFRAAVADPDAASAVGYVDLASVLDQLVAQGGDTGAEAAKYSAVQALGFSATSTDAGSRFVVRITTR